MRILMHLCCGPCGITVIKRLLASGHELVCLFFNPNIHPLSEYLRRREGAVQVARLHNVPLLLADTLPEEEQVWADPWLEGRQGTRYISGPASRAAPPSADTALWLRAVAGREQFGEQGRCGFCWRCRLQYCADMAQKNGFDGFTSSLLYSRYQNHDHIRGMGETMAEERGIAFLYQDFRVFWQEGITLSKTYGIYRQQYCGCVFSEHDRYSRDFAALRGIESPYRKKNEK